MPARAWIVTGLGNEAPYLLEWISHYHGLGFEGVVLFTHGAEDGTDLMAARLAELGFARHFPLELKAGQNLLRQGLRGLPDLVGEIGADWLMPVSIDEFLEIRTKRGDLESLLEEVGAPDALSVCRRPFGATGQRGLPSGSVRETYKLAAAEDDRGSMVSRGIKTIFRPDRVSRIAPHRPYFEDVPDPIKWFDSGGQPMPEAYFEGQWTAQKHFSHSFARLNYYSLLSPEAYLIRHGVPEDDAARKAMASDWQKLNVSSVEETGIVDAIIRSAPILKSLKEDGKLAELEREGWAWHEARIAELLKDEAIASFCEELTMMEPKKAATRTSPRGGDGTYVPPPVRPVRFKVKPSKTGETQAVLHGGFHKTATTYIQQLLETNEEWLGRKSVYVVPHQKLRKHITFPSQLDAYRVLKVRRRTKFSEEELQGFSDAFFAEPMALKPARMILSDENIPGLPAHCVTTGMLYRYRKEFFRCFAKRVPLPITDAFFAVRNYADFYASSYVEYLRAATTSTSVQMITPEVMRRNVFASLPNWQKVFGDFAAAFPETRIHVWRFEDFAELTPQILKLFCGNGVDIKKLKEPKERNARPSASARAVEELVLISELEGAGAMAGQVQKVQAQFPQDQINERFDPWSAGERAHLGSLYERDWQAICADERLITMKP